MLRDIDAVKNAILYDYNNGLAEGKVNKVKVTKRIMYSSCCFELLKKKSLQLNFGTVSTNLGKSQFDIDINSHI
jgi:hypothetical protein